MQMVPYGGVHMFAKLNIGLKVDGAKRVVRWRHGSRVTGDKRRSQSKIAYFPIPVCFAHTRSPWNCMDTGAWIKKKLE